jgi:hypothetical protein
MDFESLDGKAPSAARTGGLAIGNKDAGERDQV